MTREHNIHTASGIVARRAAGLWITLVFGSSLAFAAMQGDGPGVAVPELLGVSWNFEDGALAMCRHKDNAELNISPDAVGRSLHLTSGFSPYSFTWVTLNFPKSRVGRTAHVEFRVRGDGSGNKVRLTLGAPDPLRRQSLYYLNARQEISLDFKGWRDFRLDIDKFDTPRGGIRDRDMGGLVFLQFMITAAGPRNPVDVLFDDIRFTGLTAEELEAIENERREQEQILRTIEPLSGQNAAALDVLHGRIEEARAAGRFVDVARVYLEGLRWCNDDVRRCIDAAELSSVRQALIFARGLEARLAAPETIMGKIFERRPEEGDPLRAQENPYFLSLVKVAASMARKEQSWAKGRKGFKSIGDAWKFASLGNNCFDAAWAMTRPGSPLRHDPMLLRNSLNMLDTISHQHTDGDFNIDRTAIHGRDPNINRFCLAPALDAWRELMLAYPDLLPDAKRADIEAGLRRLVDYQVQDYGTPRLERQAHERHPVYPNMDVHHIVIMELAHRLWGDPRYARERDAFVGMLAASVYPMGAWPYINTQNECFVYHHLNVVLSARYLSLSQNPVTLAMLRKTIPFYPNNVEPAGMPEYYTDCCWKHYWSGGAATGPDVIAGLFDCPENKGVANRAGEIWGHGHGYQTAIAAEFWKPLPSRPAADNYIIHDTNIEGPRGRYGNWSFAGNGRNHGVGYQGKDTFVGCMITDPDRRPLPLDAALQIVTTEVRLTREGNHWTGGRCCSALEKLGAALGPDCGSLAVRYTLSKPNWHHENDELVPWEGVQTWILSKDRLVGLVSIIATADEHRAAVLGRIRLGMSRSIESDGKDSWRYGHMSVKLHEHSFGRIEIRPSETFFLDKPENYKSTEITLVDPLSAESKGDGPILFRKGSRYDFLVEVRPASVDPAKDLKGIRGNGFTGFHFREKGRTVCILHNATDAAISVEVPKDLLGGRGYDDISGEGRPIASAPLALGAHRHILLIRTDGPEIGAAAGASRSSGLLGQRP